MEGGQTTPPKPGGEARREAADSADKAPDRPASEQGTEAYGRDPDAEPSVTEDEVERGLKRDQTEG